MNWFKHNGLGIACCLIVAIPAWFLGRLVPAVGGPVFAILMGMAGSLLIRKKQPVQAGVSFTSKRILQLAVVLLGFGMDMSVVAQIGLMSLPVILSTVTVSLVVAFLLQKLLRIPSKTAILIGVGSSICGGSAIAATAPVIDADGTEVTQSISVIFLFNVIAALIFPTLGDLLRLTNEGFGLFAGTAVNDTSSVTAAAAAWDAVHGSHALELAAIVKMTRTLMIIPITLGLALYRSRAGRASGTKTSVKKIFPYFILLFVLASVITTVCMAAGIPAEVFQPLKTLSKFLIVMAMAAIGLNTDFQKMLGSGIKPIVLGFCCWVSIAGVSLLMQTLLKAW
ncbi:MAG: YeiH family putative sulfate export transporter [Clostridiales bacterium]|nr:YeiH family putative sulfate export transporter [Clostridiales bacterium]